MKHIAAVWLLSLLFVSTATLAHSPDKHKKSPEKPKCEAMENMSQDEMNPDDPVVQAMMKKCGFAHSGAGERHAKDSMPDHHRTNAKDQQHSGHDGH
ncbi:MAG TPA: hypothetical protein DIW43_08225 [Spongiibacteraceae bacterium]|nr:hypothetical protein [Spongiibacteraceae bacterium]HCS27427.1 hypothetical protein [Spongiibacteraceae bacterium]|tara:strand:- start:5593 stop:5883 length:291 start_codon:yes stop_codon:yes gene_type:complete